MPKGGIGVSFEHYLKVCQARPSRMMVNPHIKKMKSEIDAIVLLVATKEEKLETAEGDKATEPWLGCFILHLCLQLLPR